VRKQTRRTELKRKLGETGRDMKRQAKEATYYLVFFDIDKYADSTNSLTVITPEVLIKSCLH
jgi:hypothetical protein